MKLTKEDELFIKKSEDYRSHPYKDTVNKLTIGWGRNIEDNGISEDEGELMFQNDLKRSIKELEQYSWYLIAPDSVKKALINMNFNLGLTRLLTFKRMILALIQKDYPKAAMEAMNSKWSNQVGERARKIARMISEGE